MWQPEQIKEVRQQTCRMCYNDSTISVCGQKLKQFDKFTYPLSRTVHIDDEVTSKSYEYQCCIKKISLTCL